MTTHRSSTRPGRPPRPRRRPALASATTLGLAVSAVLVLAGVPAPVTPAGAGAADDGTLTVEPAAARTTADVTPVTVVLGADAPGPLWVVTSVHDATVDDLGAVSAGAATDPGTAAVRTAPTRLLPGERTEVRIATPLPGTALVVRVTATPAGGGTPVVAESLLLTGPPPQDAPTVTLEPADAATGPGDASATGAGAGDRALVGRVVVTAPTLVSIRAVGATTLEATERLVLPDAPLAVATTAAAWPRASSLAVTDELGRTVRATTSLTGTLLLASVLLALAVVAVTATARARRVPDIGPRAPGAEPARAQDPPV